MEPVRILFVDDDVLVLNALKRALRNDGYGMFFADGAEAALRIVADENIDIVVSDQSMPNMTGTEFLSILSQIHPRVVRVMLTGQADRVTSLAAVNEGHIDRFLEKPWDNDTLRGVLKQLASDVRGAPNVVATAPADAPDAPDATGAAVLPDE